MHAKPPNPHKLGRVEQCALISSYRTVLVQLTLSWLLKSFNRHPEPSWVRLVRLPVQEPYSDEPGREALGQFSRS